MLALPAAPLRLRPTVRPARRCWRTSRARMARLTRPLLLRSGATRASPFPFSSSSSPCGKGGPPRPPLAPRVAGVRTLTCGGDPERIHPNIEVISRIRFRRPQRHAAGRRSAAPPAHPPVRAAVRPSARLAAVPPDLPPTCPLERPEPRYATASFGRQAAGACAGEVGGRRRRRRRHDDPRWAESHMTNARMILTIKLDRIWCKFPSKPPVPARPISQRCPRREGAVCSPHSGALLARAG